MFIQQPIYRKLSAKVRQRVAEIRKRTAGLSFIICKDGGFVPSVLYPPITQYSPITEAKLFAGYTLPQDGLLDILHIPFCKRHCTFCHYPVKYEEQTEVANTIFDRNF